MTSKEAIDFLEESTYLIRKAKSQASVNRLLSKRDKSMGILKELTKRDTPMKVIKTPDWDYHCPNCKYEIDVSNVDYYCKQIYRYCYHCGQRLDWSDL